jgi:hypothetical protein
LDEIDSEFMLKDSATEELNGKVDEWKQEDEAQVEAYENVKEAIALAKEDGEF